VVDLSLRDQYQMATIVRQRGAMAGRRIAGLPTRAAAVLKSLILGRTALIILPLFLLALYFLWVRPRSPRAGGSDKNLLMLPELRKEYLELLKMVEKRGVRRRACETSLELCSRLAKESMPFVGSFRQATEVYLRVRFGGAQEHANALSAIKRARSAIKAETSDASTRS